jgi:hypothetical protein
MMVSGLPDYLLVSTEIHYELNFVTLTMMYPGAKLSRHQ